MSDPVIAGLAKRRAEMLDEVNKLEGALRGLLADIDHLDATMRQFDPEHRPQRITTSLGILERAATTKTLLAVLRTAPGPMTLRALTVEVMTRRGLDATDKKMVAQMIDRMRVALGRQRAHGTVVAKPGPGGPFGALEWRVSK
jgi:hypothetical protein